MTSYTSHIRPTERRICDRILAAILATEGLFVRVYDGEEWATEWTRDLALVRPEIAATDETRLFLMDVDAETGAATRLGSILLIHGNEEDLISDSSWNPKAAGAEQLVERLCQAGNA
jgi:hypothetical protein